MESPDDRVQGKDRSAAIGLVENALKSGRIIQADHDLRIEQLKVARTMREIDQHVRDLQPPVAVSAAPITPIPPIPPTPSGQASVPDPVMGAGGSQPWPLVNYGPASHQTVDLAEVMKKSSRGVGGIIAAVMLVAVVVPIVGAVIAFASARDSFDFDALGPTDDTTYAPGETPGKNGINVHTVDGFTALVDALREDTGQTQVYSAVLYPRYAVLEVPLTSGTGRYQNYHWDGTLETQDFKGTTTDASVDLAAVRPDQMIGMLKLVRSRVEAPESWYVSISHPTGIEAQISAYASNEFGETSYIVETFDGTVIYDSDAQ